MFVYILCLERIKRFNEYFQLLNIHAGVAELHTQCAVLQ